VEDPVVPPHFSLADVRYAAYPEMFGRALALFREQKVKEFSREIYGYSALVQGGSAYRVRVSGRHIDEADCDCYMGQNEQLCKHVFALALEVLRRAGVIDNEGNAVGDVGPLTTEGAKMRITAGMRKIKAYEGPSRTWFRYQMRLSVGCGMILETAKRLKPTAENARLLWKTVLRLSKKLATGGVDDSDGTVGDCCSEIVALLRAWAKKSDAISDLVVKFAHDETGFGFEEELVAPGKSRP